MMHINEGVFQCSKTVLFLASQDTAIFALTRLTNVKVRACLIQNFLASIIVSNHLLLESVNQVGVLLAVYTLITNE